MANFRTHAAVGVVASGMLATLTMAANVVPPNELITLALAGALGSVLPDIDLQNSRASRAMFAGLGIFFAFACLFNMAIEYSIAEMWIVWVGTFVGVRYVGHNIFHKYARHRGVFHSLIAALFFAFAASAIYYHLFSGDPTLCWLTGAFVLFGVLVHLALDELYSVDFHGHRVKRSFGTALKIYDGDAPMGSLALAAAATIAFLSAPAVDPFVEVVGSQEIWAMLNERMLPEGSWFGFIADVDRVAVAPVAEDLTAAH